MQRAPDLACDDPLRAGVRADDVHRANHVGAIDQMAQGTDAVGERDP